MMHLTLRLKILLFQTALLLTACTPWGENLSEKPHVIVIAVESLSFDDASCVEEVEDDNLFSDICKESLRFTHFYTPSTLSQPALASLLTGLTPTEHKVLHNGGQGIPVPLETAPEKALKAGYRTAFFSGGPPVLSKSGFQQGFEIFDDDFLKEDQMFVPAQQTLRKAAQWLGEQKSSGFVSVYLADMQFPGASTFTDEGKERGKGAMSQREELAESIAEFFNTLKAKKLWTKTYVMIVGLNGEPLLPRKGILWRENLYRENMHVPLFLKTPRPLGETRSFDGLLTMKDAGQLLFRILDSRVSETESVLQKLDEWTDSPYQYIEARSDWRSWWFGLAPEISLRTYDYLIFPRQEMVLYHSLVDKNEMIPLKESQVESDNLRWLKYRFGESYDKDFEMKNDIYDFLQYLRVEKQSKATDILANLPKGATPGGLTALLRADRALKMGDWAELGKIDSAIYKYVAAKNGSGDQKITLTHSCDRLFYDSKRPTLLRKCRDSLFLALLDWEKRREASDSLYWEKSFVRKYRFYIEYKRIAYMNLNLELNWDVDVSDLIGPSLAELYLSLPEKAALRKRLESYKVPLHVSFI